MLPEIMDKKLKILDIEGLKKEARDPPVQELKWNFKTNDFEFDKFMHPIILRTKKEIIKQWILKCFLVYRDSYRVYYKDKKLFGLKIQDYQGMNPAIAEYAMSEIKRNIIETLQTHVWIKSIVNYEASLEQDIYKFQFDIILKDSEERIVGISEVINLVN